jgi:hypothetical protein
MKFHEEAENIFAPGVTLVGNRLSSGLGPHKGQVITQENDGP